MIFFVHPGYAENNKPQYFFSDDTPTIVFNRIDKALEQHPAPYERGQERKTYLHVIDNNQISVYLVDPVKLWLDKKHAKAFSSAISSGTLPAEVLEALSKSGTKKPFTKAAFNLQQNPETASRLEELKSEGAELAGVITIHGTVYGRTYVSWERSLKRGTWVINNYDFLKKVVEQRQTEGFSIEKNLLLSNVEPPIIGVAIKVPSFFETSQELQEQRNQLDGTPIDTIHELKMNKLIERARRLGDNITTSLRERRDEYLQYDRTFPTVEIIDQLA